MRNFLIKSQFMIFLISFLVTFHPLPVDSFERIAVIPVDPGTENLTEGAEVLNSTLAEHFMNTSTVMVVTPEQYEALSGDLTGNKLQTIQKTAERLNSDATLIVTLHRFRQRKGDGYSTDTPTSLAFNYQLIRSADGRSVCNGSYDETQEALTDNILKLKSALKRKFKWISAEEMAREAFKKKFSTCPALVQAISQQ